MTAIEGAGVNPEPVDNGDGRAGMLAGLSCYGIWGFFPILFHALDAVNPFAVVAHRIVWSFLLVGGVLVNRGRMQEVRRAVRSPSALRGIAISTALLSINWVVFVWGVVNAHVVEVSFGYFINPLVSVAIGMVFLSERLNKWQLLSIGIAVVAILIQAIGLNGIPVVSLALAFSFGTYGYFRKTVDVASTPGLFIETLLMLPVAIVYLTWLVMAEGPGAMADPLTFGLLVLTGPATSGALILFAFAARRLPLSTMGMFQYITPSMHLIFALTLFGEPINRTQLLSFALIWVSLAVFSWDSVRRRRYRLAVH